ncbi:hypothetical protein [Agrococcus sp. ARC_14]|uniref:hypothetical protein n=1 Tax=Agrococcus sp. ARC_14 TaxID=2919927 RepID=UPI001F05B7EE|nr:hypothetical protein [Agrococcus sp. ARC_14]MCH1883941.1 hypothetical protein [Agrococcus sp. ARC_14]
MDAVSSRPSARAVTVAGWGAVVAPFVGLLLMVPTAGWLLVAMVWTFPIWIIGYGLVATAATFGMLRRGGALRPPSAARTRAIAWAWLASIGVLIVGMTVVGGGDAPDSAGSMLTRMLGVTESESALFVVSGVVSFVAAVPWLAGSVALVVEWLTSVIRRRPRAERIAPPVVP